MTKMPSDMDSEPRTVVDRDDDDHLTLDDDFDSAPADSAPADSAPVDPPRRPARSSDPLPADSPPADSAPIDPPRRPARSSDPLPGDDSVVDPMVDDVTSVAPSDDDDDDHTTDLGGLAAGAAVGAAAGAAAGDVTGATAGESVGVANRWRAWRVDGYLKRQERQRVRDEKWSRRYRKRRHRILPRTVIGTVLLLVALAVGAAFAGTVLYTWYDFRLKETQESVEVFTTEFEARFQEASQQITRQREEAEASIEERLVPLRELTEESTSTTELAANIAPSVFFVRTLDEDGRSAAGSAFVVGSDSNQSYLVTSYEVVKASTREPGPGITLTATDREIEATLWQWEEDTDMAVLTVDEGDLPVLPWVSQDLARNPIGTRIYAGGGLGSQGASVSPGLVIDVSAAGLQHTAAVGTAYRGGPLLTGNGEVLGMLSTDYSPLNFDPGAVTFAPNIVAACNGLLDCSGRIPTLEQSEEADPDAGQEEEPAAEDDTEG